jgi:hypothetical protein
VFALPYFFTRIGFPVVVSAVAVVEVSPVKGVAGKSAVHCRGLCWWNSSPRFGFVFEKGFDQKLPVSCQGCETVG